MRFHKSLKWKVSSSTILILLSGFLFLAITTYVIVAEELVKNAEIELIQRASDATKLIEERLRQKIVEMEAISQRKELQSMNWEIQKEVLKEELKRLNYLGLGIVFPNGTARYPTGKTAQLGDRGYVKKAFQGKTNISNVLISRVIHAPVMMIATPIKRKNKVVGVFIARMDGKELSRITNDITYGETGYTYVIDSKGVIIAHQDEDLVMEKYNLLAEVKKNKEMFRLKEIVEEMIENKSGFGSYRYNNQELYVGYSPIKSMGWSIGINVEKNEVLKLLDFMKTTFIIITVIALFLGIIISILMANSITEPIKRVSNISRDLAKGDLSVKLFSVTKDEIGDMNKNLNVFLERLKGIISEIKNVSQNIGNNSEQVSEQMKNITDGSLKQLAMKEELERDLDEIKKKMENILGNVKDQVEETKVMAGSIQEVSLTVTQVAKNAKSTMSLSNEAYNCAEDGFKLVDKTMEGIAKIEDDSQKIDEKLKNLYQISEQIDLLALNAAIEASSAGEKGKGFAIVAEEVKKLSTISQEFTESISKLNVAMKKNVKDSAELSIMTKEKIKEVKEKVSVSNQEVSNVSKAVEEQVMVMNEIKVGTQKLAKANAEIEAKSIEQTEIISESNKMLKLISGIIEKNTTSTEETKLSTGELLEIAKKLNKMINQLKLND